MPGSDWTRLSEAVVARRKALGYKHRKDFAPLLPFSSKTLDRVEQGKRVSAETLTELDTHLKWAPGSASAVLHGADPKPLAPARVEQGPRAGDRLVRRSVVDMTRAELFDAAGWVAEVDGEDAGEQWLRNALQLRAKHRREKQDGSVQTFDRTTADAD